MRSDNDLLEGFKGFIMHNFPDCSGAFKIALKKAYFAGVKCSLDKVNAHK